jgi:hypothetical protein
MKKRHLVWMLTLLFVGIGVLFASYYQRHHLKSQHREAWVKFTKIREGMAEGQAFDA